MPRPDPTRHRRRMIRLSILAVIALLIAGGLYGLFTFQSGRQQVETDQVLDQARQAHEEQDSARVIELLENPKSQNSTISEIRDDAELLKAYVKARRETPLENGEHLFRLVAPLQQIVRLTPEDTEAREELLTLLIQMQRFSEARRIADDLTELFPKDASLWRYLGDAQLNLRKRELALEAYQTASELEPLHVNTQAMIIQLLSAENQNIQPLIDNAEQTYHQFPNDPRAELIRALACLVEQDLDRATELMRLASERQPPDDTFIPVMVEWLDRVNLYSVATGYLNRVAGDDASSYAGRQALLRAYEAGDVQGVLTRLEESKTDPHTAHPDLVAMWALANLAQQNTARAAELISALHKRDEIRARAWAQALRVIQNQESQPGQVIDKLAAFTEVQDPLLPEQSIANHHYIHLALGEAYLLVSEPEAAILVIKQAAENRRSWARPHRLLTRILLDLNQPREALEYAELAWQRQPNLSTTAMRVEAQLAAADPTEPESIEEALRNADQLLTQLPDHPTVLPATVGLLARANRSALAKQLIKNALSLDPPASASLLQTLAELSQRYNLGLESSIQTTFQQHHNASPASVLRQARALAESGQPEEGRGLIQAAMPDPASLGWRVAMGQYLRGINANDAAAYWVALADDQPDSLQLQRDALDTPAVRSDTAFVQRAIKRLRTLGGERSVQWRLEQARLLMLNDPSQADLKQALDVLRPAERAAPDRLETQLELTRCLFLLGDLTSAEQSARKAKAIAPNRISVRLLLGQVLHQQQRYNESRLELIPVADDNSASPNLRFTACALLYEQGEIRPVREALEAMRQDGSTNNAALLLLARIYAQENNTAEADAICEQLLRSADMQALTFITRYYAQTGRPELAEQASQSDQAVQLSRADRLTLNAQSQARRGEADLALTYLKDAAEAEPDNVQRWRYASEVALAFMQPDLALSFAERGLEEADEDLGLRSLLEHRKLIKSIQNDNTLVPFAVAILSSDTLRGPAIQALRLVSNQSDPVQTGNQLAALADEYAAFQALCELAGNRLVQAGLNREAYELTSSSMIRFPTSAASARDASVAAYRLGDWSALANTSQQWGKRDPGNRHLADLMLASAQEAQGQHAAVIQALAPHMNRPDAQPDRNPQYLMLYTRALIRTEQTEKAWDLLQPHLATSPSVRMLALQRIGEDLADADTAAAWLDAVSDAAGEVNAEQYMRARAAFLAGSRLDHLGLKQTAQQTIDQALAEPGNHPAEAYTLQGQIAQTLGDLSAAEKSFRRVLKLTPKSPQVLNNLAIILSDRGGASLREAEQLARNATELAEDDPNLLDTLAMIQLRLGKLEQADQTITRVIQIDPTNPAWRLTQADILEAQGKTERAERIRERFESSIDD